LDIVCHLFFGAWIYFYSRAQILLDILFNFINVFGGRNAWKGV